MRKNIVLIASLDAKGHACYYVKNFIENKGYNVVSVDVGTEVVKAAASNTDEVFAPGKTDQENRVVDTMTEGMTRVCHDLFAECRMDGIICIGGATETIVGTKVMSMLPSGIPKVMLSTLTSDEICQYVSPKGDICMLSSSDETAGLNGIPKISLLQAAGALIGMAEAENA
jgi:uncharacterized protein (UPF0261 family)